MVDFITLQQLKSVLPQAKVDTLTALLPALDDTFATYGIDSPARIAMFIAQTGYETNQFLWLHELASGAEYEGRKDLGNTQVGDGVRYKGRGLIQITGRANYAACASDTLIDCLNHPELLEQPRYAAISAGWFWDKRKLNRYADTFDCVGATKVINGGTNGLADRLALYQRAKSVFGTQAG